jgi:hypothetical protein
LFADSADEAPGVESEIGVDKGRDRSLGGRAMRRRWRELIKRVDEVDPLVCPSCGGEMKIIAFIIDHGVVDAMLRHLERRSRIVRVRGPRDPAHSPVLRVGSAKANSFPSPEILRFDEIVDGRALRAVWSGHPFYRVAE